MPILLEPDCRHFLLQRSFTRARGCTADDPWDWDCPLAKGAQATAAKIRSHHFPTLVPQVVLHSALPRAKETARLMWGDMPLHEDVRLGPRPSPKDNDDPYVAASTISIDEIWRGNPHAAMQAMDNLGYVTLQTLHTIPRGTAAWGVSHGVLVKLIYALSLRDVFGTHERLSQIVAGGVLHLKFEGEGPFNLTGVQHYNPPC